jgi:ABC-type multidrug transport system fused ATPase/permease subunit
MRLFSYAKDIKLIFIIGIASTLLNAACFPAFSVLLGRIITWLLLFKLDPTQMRDKIDKNILYLMLISIGYFAVTFLQQALLNNVGVNIIIQIRKEVFAKILKMPIPWF